MSSPGIEAGADDYVAKDSAGEIILGRVRRLIEFRQMSGLAMLNQQLAQVAGCWPASSTRSGGRWRSSAAMPSSCA